MRRKLTELCDIQYGYAFDSAGFTEDSSYPPLARIRDVKRGYSETYFSEEYPEEYVLHAGDLLVGMDGEFNIARWKSRDALLNQRVCKIIAKEGSDEEYLRFALSKALKEIENRTAFVTVKHLSAKELNKLELQVPALPEQERISSVLARTEGILALRQSELQTLDDLIKARFVEMFGDPNVNSLNWKMGVISDIGRCVAGATPSTARPEYWKDGTIPWLSSGEVNKGRIYETDAKITQQGYDNASTKMVPAKTVVLAMAGQGKTRGTAAITEIELCTNQSICSIVGNGRVNHEYLLAFLRMQYKELRNASTSAEGRGGLNLKIIGSYPIMIPPIELQNQFASFVSQVNKSKAVVQKALDKSQFLFDSLMQQYFG